MRKIKREKKKELMIAVILVTAIFVLMWIIRPWKQKVVEVAKDPEVPKVRRAIDGVMIEKGNDNPPLAGVMIENMIEAQPLSGIADARLVFEAVAEANITRFLAYFVLPAPSPGLRPPSPAGRGTIDDSSPGPTLARPVFDPRGRGEGEGNIEIGPVRSARPYYLDFAAEFDTLYGHVGSSPAAYELLRSTRLSLGTPQGLALLGIHDLDQWYNSQYFFEKVGRPRPHHLYTSTGLLTKAYQAMLAPTTPNPSSGRRGNESISSPFEGEVRRGLSSWQFKNDASPDLRGDVREILIGYTPPYNLQWQYDAQANQYGRVQWARPNFSGGKVSVGYDGVDKDANGKEIIAKNIAVAFMEMKVLDEVGRKEFTTIGEGKGLVFQDGRVVVGTWKKPSARERMRWYDGQGNEVKFNAGTTWVEIVPKGYEVKY